MINWENIVAIKLSGSEVGWRLNLSTMQRMTGKPLFDGQMVYGTYKAFDRRRTRSR